MRILAAAVAILAPSICQHAMAAELYFPESVDRWETVTPASVGWDEQLLAAALDVAGERDSSGVLILHNGRILTERYWALSDTAAGYQNFVSGTDTLGHVIEDVASAQKSVVAVLTGMAQERGYLAIDDPVSTYLGVGWSRASVMQEQAITIRHLLSMNSGLATDFTFLAAPGTQWLYNTPVYHSLMRVVVAATGMDRDQLTAQWITGPIGMTHSAWTPRPWASADIGVGFSTTVRELAMFGLMLQAGGRWREHEIINDGDYIKEMLSPSQSLNPAYGYLWWLNGQAFSRTAAADAQRVNGPLIAEAPADLVAMQGALDRKLYMVPSLNLIVTRLGGNGAASGESFNQAFWRALMRAAPR